ncbi:MAG TPA: hypothetical protein VIV58_17090 [Kofleriaceae bacterium]
MGWHKGIPKALVLAIVLGCGNGDANKSSDPPSSAQAARAEAFAGQWSRVDNPADRIEIARKGDEYQVRSVRFNLFIRTELRAGSLHAEPGWLGTELSMSGAELILTTPRGHYRYRRVAAGA